MKKEKKDKSKKKDKKSKKKVKEEPKSVNKDENRPIDKKLVEDKGYVAQVQADKSLQCFDYGRLFERYATGVETLDKDQFIKIMQEIESKERIKISPILNGPAAESLQAQVSQFPHGLGFKDQTTTLTKDQFMNKLSDFCSNVDGFHGNIQGQDEREDRLPTVAQLSKWDDYVAKQNLKSGLIKIFTPVINQTFDILNRISHHKQLFADAIAVKESQLKEEWNKQRSDLCKSHESLRQDLADQERAQVHRLESIQAHIVNMLPPCCSNIKDNLEDLETRSRSVAFAAKIQAEISQAAEFLEKQVLRASTGLSNRSDSPAQQKAGVAQERGQIQGEKEILQRSIELKDKMIFKFIKEKEAYELERGQLLQDIKRLSTSFRQELNLWKHQSKKRNRLARKF